MSTTSNTAKRPLLNLAKGHSKKRIKPAQDSPSPPFSPSELTEPIEEYATGAILRIHVLNFLTYTACLIRPGPYLNMIMGPNGSGKSSIVAAIALGLGANPGVLGRSKQLEEYIQYGESIGSIEVVLKSTNDPQSLGNLGYVTIKRVLAKKDYNYAGNEWYIDELPANLKKVREVVKALNINLDNLCQFMPQDKVSEFAKLSPSDLLRETERTAADLSVISLHDTLASWKAEEQRLALEQDTDAKLICSRQDVSNNIEGIFESLRVREEHLQTAEYCRKKALLLQYEESREDYEASRTEHELAKKKLEEADATAGPLRQRIADLQSKLSDLQVKVAPPLEKQQMELDAICDKMTALHEQQAKIKGEIESSQRSSERKRREKDEIQRIMSRLHSDIAGIKEVVYDPDFLREDLRLSLLRQDSITRELDELERSVEKVRRDGESINAEISDARKQLNKLADAKERRRECLFRSSPDTIRALEWLSSHRDLFQSAVHGPIALDLHIKRSAPSGSGKAIEGLLSKNVLNAFVFTDIDDQRLFMRHTMDEMKLRVGSILVDLNSTQSHNLDVKKLGFDCMAIDCVEGPEPILRAVSEQSGLDTTPIALNNEVDHNTLTRHPTIRRYVSVDSLYAIKVSRYSPDDRIVRCTSIRPPVLFTDSLGSDDQERVKEWQEKINKHNQTLIANAESLKPLLLKQQDRQSQLEKSRQEHRRITEERAKRKAEWEERERKVKALAVRQEELENIDSVLVASKNQESDFLAEYDSSLKRRLDCVRQGSKAVKKMEESYQSVSLSYGLQHIVWCNDISRMQIDLQSKQDENRSLKQALQEKEANMRQLKDVSKSLLNTINSQGIPHDASRNHSKYASLPDTREDLTKREAVERTRAEAKERECIGVDFEKLKREQAERQSELARIRDRSSTREIHLNELRVKIHKAKEEWLSAIRPLINNISESFGKLFARLGCVGQVDLESGPAGEDDFAGYQLVIRVKFRAEEHLQRLTGSRQSGGEKSVSTILYLLALSMVHSVSNAVPFRVVDEINQGMDADNERKVHGMVVETSEETGSQYFLITPKLLSGLEYTERMHVLCVLTF